MPTKISAPACRKAEGAVCLLGGDASANSKMALQTQVLRRRHAVPQHLTGLFANLAFGESKQ
jgi:hypothetical protein